MDTKSAYDPARLGIKGCFGFGVIGLILALSLLLNTCVSRVEVIRAKSPDGTLTARVYEIDGGATTDFAYRVDIARSWPFRWDHTVADFYGAVRSDCAYGVNIRWANNDTLLISYKEAKSSEVDRAAHLLGRTIRIVAEAGANDPDAACGGMEYGQQASAANVR